MFLRLLLCSASVVGLGAQTLPRINPTVQTNEQTLAAVLRWEILWNDSPRGFRAPTEGPLTLAVYSTPDTVSYCSHQAGVCVKYRADGYRNWQESFSSKCDDNGSDEEALTAFISKDSATVGNLQPRTVLGRGLSGIPAPQPAEGFSVPVASVRWTGKISLGSRAEIIRDYQQMDPADIESLKSWLRSPATPHSGVRGMTIACSAPSDPLIYYFIDRSAGAPVIMAVFWDRDRQEWVIAASFERNQIPEKFDEMRRTIESVACSTVTFP